MTRLLDTCNRLHTLPTLRGQPRVYTPTLGGPLTFGGYPPNVCGKHEIIFRSLNLYEHYVLNVNKHFDETRLFLSLSKKTF